MMKNTNTDQNPTFADWLADFLREGEARFGSPEAFVEALKTYNQTR